MWPTWSFLRRKGGEFFFLLSALLHAPPAPSRHARCRPCNPYPCPRLYPAKPPKATVLNVGYNIQPRAGGIVRSGPPGGLRGCSEQGHQPPLNQLKTSPPSLFSVEKIKETQGASLRPGPSHAYFFSSAAGFCFWYCGSVSRYFSICSVSCGLDLRSAKIVNASTGVKFSFRISLAGV